MAVKIRLMRMGKKKQPTYRVVVADSRSPRDGRFIELIGRYDPRPDPSVVEIDTERALHWLSNGAQPTAQVRKLLEISGAWGRHQVASGQVHVVGGGSKPARTATATAAKVVDEVVHEESLAETTPAEPVADDGPEIELETEES
jgi:small subunit ribosomal protein S16